ncbi:MAG: hypothetical protein ABGY75_00590 [Gemmataceae bacterium]
MSTKSPRHDRRLIGTWKSDRRMTFRHWKPKPGCPPESERKFKALFGKLVVRWERGRYHSEIDGHRETVPYEVMAADSASVVIRFRDPYLGERLQQLFFDGDRYWVATPLAPGMVEYFRRVTSNDSSPRRGG